MAKDPAALFYTDKWIAATQGMRGIEKGWYLELILYQFDKGPIPNNLDEMASICRIRPSEFKMFEQVFEQVLKQKFQQNDEGMLENEFAKEIIQKRKLFKEKRSMSGKMSYVIRYAKTKMKLNDKQLDIIKSNFDFNIDIKNEQILNTCLNKCLNTYSNKKVNTLNVNVNVNKDSSIIKDSTSNYNNILMSELFSSDESDSKNLKIKFEIPEKDKQPAQIAYQFWTLIKSNLEKNNISTVQHEKSIYKNWIPPIRFIIQNKEATIEQLREIHSFLKKDSFWQTRVLSTEKLRKQVQQLLLDIRKNEKNTGHYQSSSEQRRSIAEKKDFKNTFD